MTEFFFILALLACIWYVRVLSGYADFYRRILPFLRAVSFLLVLLIVLNPSRTVVREIQEKNNLAVLIDHSRSMAFDRKFERSQAVCEKIVKKLKDHFHITSFYFSDTIAPVKGASAEFGTVTDILGSIADTERYFSGQKTGGIIIISDGQQNFSSQYQREVFKTPVFTVAVDRTTERQDIKVVSVKIPDAVFVSQPADVSVTVEQRGYQGLTVPIIVKKDNAIIHQESILLDSETVHTSFQIVISEPKDVLCSFSIPPRADEITDKNNSVQQMVSVKKQQSNVLLVCGAVCADYGFFRRVISQHSAVKCDSVLLMKDAKIPDPSLYDAIIALNVNTELPDMKKIYDAVKSGKNFLFLTGPDTILSDDFMNILPVVGKNISYSSSNFQFHLSPYGLNHPLLRLSSNFSINEAIWKDFPRYTGRIEGMHPRTGTKILLGSEENPELIISSGAHQVVFAGFDSIARIHLYSQAFSPENDYMIRFVLQLIQYITENQDSQLSVSLARSEIATGMKNTVFVTAHEQTAQIQAENIKITCISPSGKILDLLPQMFSEGNFRADISTDEDGKYAVIVENVFGNTKIAEKKVYFVSSAATDEIEKLVADRNFLSRISYQNSGLSADENSVELITDKIIPQAVKREIKETDFLWHRWWIFILFCITTGLEWFLRKRGGIDE